MKNEAIINTKPLGFPWETQDPFLFCVHHADVYPPGNDVMGPSASLEGRDLGNDFTVKDGFRMYHGQTVPGFPAHPHRGFETVTVVNEGLIDHADSLGAAGRFGNGDVQWMTAGSGVQHSEMFPLLNRDNPNPLEFFQIWLNLPPAKKFAEPHFKMLWGDTIPVVKTEDKSGKSTEIIVVAGQVNDKKAPPPAPDSWAADADNDVAIWRIKMEPEAEWTLPKAKEGTNRTLYFFAGSSIEIAEQMFESHRAIELKPNLDLLIKNGPGESQFLLLQGKPIGEPVAQHGPFVMNTQTEIQQAMNDYQRTQFGGWPWPQHDHVHPREQGRFAKHADGKLEQKE